LCTVKVSAQKTQDTYLSDSSFRLNDQDNPKNYYISWSVKYTGAHRCTPIVSYCTSLKRWSTTYSSNTQHKYDAHAQLMGKIDFIFTIILAVVTDRWVQWGVHLFWTQWAKSPKKKTVWRSPFLLIRHSK